MQSAGHDAGHAFGATGSSVQFAEEVGIGGAFADSLPLLAGVIGALEEVLNLFAEVIWGRGGTGCRMEFLNVVFQRVFGIVVRVGEHPPWGDGSG